MNAPPTGPLLGRSGNANPFPTNVAQNTNSNPSQVSVSASLPRFKPGREGLIPLNQEGSRLDFYLKPPTAEQWSAYTHRAKIHKLCNDYQLSGQCSSGDQCHYDHSNLEPDLKHVLRLIVHDYPCGRKGACRIKNCNLGRDILEVTPEALFLKKSKRPKTLVDTWLNSEPQTKTWARVLDAQVGIR